MIDEDPQKIKSVPKQFTFSLREIKEDPFEDANEHDKEAEQQEHSISKKRDQGPVETEQEQILNESLEPTLVMIGSPLKKRMTLRDNFISDFLNSDL